MIIFSAPVQASPRFEQPILPIQRVLKVQDLHLPKSHFSKLNQILYVDNTEIGILKKLFKAWTASTTQSHSHLSPAHLWVSSSPLEASPRAGD